MIAPGVPTACPHIHVTRHDDADPAQAIMADTADLTSKQRAHLRSLAHHLKPILHIGKDGVSDAAVAAVEDAFSNRELLKVKVLESAPEETQEAAEALAARIEGAHVAQVIGRVVVLYRRDPEAPEIVLP